MYDEVWKQQLRMYKSNIKRQPPMLLPKINTLVGRYTAVRPSIYDELNYKYSQYSKSYWEGVKQRQKEYLVKTYLYYF
jgi:hypothetical protein